MENKQITESLYCYLRVSSKAQVDEGNSIEQQRNIGKKIAKKLKLKYVEMNESGYSSMAKIKQIKLNIKRKNYFFNLSIAVSSFDAQFIINLISYFREQISKQEVHVLQHYHQKLS